ncbi:MAG: lysylphosphatidylglycerol synthase transmembrane domain-containing protein [Bacteroidaceae bacterium]
MKAKYRNIFLIAGVAAIVIMLFTFNISIDTLTQSLRRAGYWFPAVIGIWIFIYSFNALSWYYIIRRGEKTCPISFLKVLKLSITGFALNYATPCGLMGGEPYRIMELSPYVGVARATSSVILYVMMHIFSHIWFWLLSIVLYLLFYPTNSTICTICIITLVLLLVIIYFFIKGYKNGMALKTLRLLTHLPFIKKWAQNFLEKQRENLERIDCQIAELHTQKRSTFYTAFGFEFTSRVLTSLEIYFILKIMMPEVNFLDCVMIMAFTSLFSNLFFFSPMQLGAREGGFALAVGGLAIPTAIGVYTGIISRVREIVWISIGVILMKIGNLKK